MVTRHPAPLAATPATDVSSEPLRLSIIVEWENTRRNGIPRALALLDTLGRQWQAITERSHPETLPPEAARFLDRLAPRPELVAVSGEALSEEAKQEIR